MSSDNLEQPFSYQQQSDPIKQQHRLDDLLPKQRNCSIIATFGKVQVGNSLTHYFDANEVGPSEQQGESYTLWHTSVSYQVNPQQSITLVISNLTNESYKLTNAWQF